MLAVVVKILSNIGIESAIRKAFAFIPYWVLRQNLIAKVNKFRFLQAGCQMKMLQVF